MAIAKSTETELENLKQKWIKEQLYSRQFTVLKDPEWLAARLVSGDLLVGGMDISFSQKRANFAVAALAIVELKSLKVVHQVTKEVELDVPYIPTFLGFREVGPFEELVKSVKLEHPEFMPHVLMVDGNGTLHPRRFGSACQLGCRLGQPTIGVAKNLLNVTEGNHDQHEPRLAKLSEKQMAKLKHSGDRLEILDENGGICGWALLSCDKAKNPVYVSPGHLISMETACEVTCKMSIFRVPEPTRMDCEGLGLCVTAEDKDMPGDEIQLKDAID
ncbi:unnamed protein product [Calicophoron daubneyi]|uniref:Endonuclease V n=1 Tax=Calicophoron daubneyi TaxID=300641 RepID=A0AAV2TT27_CALDB